MIYLHFLSGQYAVSLFFSDEEHLQEWLQAEKDPATLADSEAQYLRRARFLSTETRTAAWPKWQPCAGRKRWLKIDFKEEHVPMRYNRMELILPWHRASWKMKDRGGETARRVPHMLAQSLYAPNL